MAKKQQESPRPQEPAMSRFDAATEVIQQLKEPTTLTALNQTADARYVKAGGESNLKQQLWSTRQAVRAAVNFKIVEVIANEVTVRPLKPA